MGAGSLYYYFDSREALIEEVILTGVRRTQQAVAERLERMRPDASSRERLRAAIEEHLLMGLKQSEYSSAAIMLLNQLPDEIRARIVAVERAYGRLWHALLEEGRRAGEIRADVNLSVVRMAILGALNWSPEWYRPNGASPQRIARDIATLVLDGLCTKGRASAIKE
jgi:AcrR family transcriptional regulator